MTFCKKKNAVFTQLAAVKLPVHFFSLTAFAEKIVETNHRVHLALNHSRRSKCTDKTRK